VVFGVVATREHESQPNGHHPSAAQPWMQPVILDFAVVNLREVHLHQQTENQRQII
jgi:hypothetical protein